MVKVVDHPDSWYREQGTTRKRHHAAEAKRLATPTPWKILCDYFCKTFGVAWEDLFCADTRARRCYRAWGRGRPANHHPGLLVSQSLPLLLLASQRRTNLTIDRVGASLGLDPWDTLRALQRAELRLARDEVFAEQFDRFLDGFDAGKRAQAFTVQEGFNMTYEEVGERMGLAWQRVQQIEQKALAKLRNNPEAIAALKEAM